MKRLLAIAVIAAVTLGAAGCGESQVTVFKQGQYQGKPDNRPWENDQFKGDKLAWERTIKARNDIQDETSRGTPTAKN